jgi:endonuclease YncB( thermonuclease family)
MGKFAMLTVGVVTGLLGVGFSGGATADSGQLTAALTVNPAASNAQQVTVTKVIDGDSLELSDGRTIRVLGIDSCEMNTPGGQQAKSAAETQLGTGPVTLTSEPGVDLDRYGRHLRYVQVGSVDLGESLVRHDHTGVYQDGDNDASDAYVQRLYANDLTFAANPPSGRECGAPYSPAPRTTRQAPPPAQERPASPPAQSGGGGSGCHPSYVPCVPDSPRDLDCPDVGHQVRVVGPDEYRLDGSDNDGKGCESY